MKKKNTYDKIFLKYVEIIKDNAMETQNVQLTVEGSVFWGISYL